jgi:hypothetical protein
LGTQRTFCFKPRGSPGSSPLRSDGSHDDQAGEAGPVEHKSTEAKNLKLEAKRLSGCHPSGQQPRQPDGKARGQVKDYSHNNLQNNTELKAALTRSTVRQKAKKERRLLYALILKLQKGIVSGLMKSVMSENQNSQSQVHATASRYLRFKPGKRGLNSPFTFPARGEGVLTHYLIT